MILMVDYLKVVLFVFQAGLLLSISNVFFRIMSRLLLIKSRGIFFILWDFEHYSVIDVLSFSGCFMLFAIRPHLSVIK